MLGQTLTPKTFSDLATQIDRMTDRVQSCCPDPGNKIDSKEDYDAVSLSLAKIMRTCALTLRDSGYEVDNAIAEAASVLVQARRGECPSRVA